MFLSRIQTYLEMLRTDPLGFLIYIAYLAVTVLLSLILHECAHGYVALKCGDPTAKMMGRLTLDPRAHLDPIGTVSMLLIGVGWAKPVPVNPRNFKGDYRKDDFLVSIAGITVNFTIFLLCSSLSVGVNRFLWADGFLDEFREVFGSLQGTVNQYAEGGVYASYIMYGLNYSALSDAIRYPALMYVQRFLLMMASMNLGLAIFNFIPFPPLDGFHIFNDLLLRGRFQLNPQTFRIAHMVFLLVILSGLLDSVLSACNGAVYSAFINLWLMISGG